MKSLILAAALASALAGSTFQATPQPPLDWKSIRLPGGDAAHDWPLALKNIEKKQETRWFGQGGRVECRQTLYADGSRVEIGYGPKGRRGWKLYERGGPRGRLKSGHGDPYAANANLRGIRVQYFPDCSGDTRYTGAHPCMVIYCYRDGRDHQLGFSPKGTLESDFWFEDKDNILLFRDVGGPKHAVEDRAKAALAEAARTEFGSAGYLCEDTLAVAKACGVDYVRVVGGCLARDRQAMSLLFWLSAHGGFDAASAEGHSTVVGLVLRRVGDGFFAECLAGEPLAVRQAVLGDVRYDAGYDTGTEKQVMHALMRDFPRTLSLTPSHRALEHKTPTLR